MLQSRSLAIPLQPKTPPREAIENTIPLGRGAHGHCRSALLSAALLERRTGERGLLLWANEASRTAVSIPIHCRWPQLRLWFMRSLASIRP